MAPAELVILSSSPHDIPKRHVYSVPSSPNREPYLPSLKPSYRKPLKSGSRAGEIPLGAAAGFCTASAFVRINGTGLEPKLAAEPMPSNAQGIESFADLAAAQSEPEGSKEHAKRQDRPKTRPNKKPEQRKPRKTKDEHDKLTMTDEPSKGNQKRTNKPTKRKSTEVSETMQQMQLEKGNVTKPNILASIPETKGFRYPPGLKQTDQTSKHFDYYEHRADERSHNAQPPDQTQKCRPTSPTSYGSESSKENLNIMTTAELSLPNKTARPPEELSPMIADQSLETHTAHTDTVNPPCAVQTEEGQSVAKRRKVQPAKSISPTKKIKQPSKSSRTITGLALAVFRNPEPEEHSVIAANDCSVPPVLFPEHSDTTNKITKKKTPKKANEATKAKSRKSRKRSMSPVPKLLSPATARKKMKKQDFLFGTSSQLVRDESPTFIRDLQQAMKLSDTESSLPNEAAIVGDNGTSVVDDRLGRANRDLWFSASRVVNEHVADLYRPEPLKSTRPAEGQSMQVISSDFVDIDALNSSSPRSSAVAYRALPGSSPPILATVLQESEPQMSRLKLASAKHSRSKSTLMCAMDEAVDYKEELPEHVTKAPNIVNPLAKDDTGEPKGNIIETLQVTSRKKASTEVKAKDDTHASKKPRGRPRKNPAEPPKTTKRSKKTKIEKTQAPANAVANIATIAADDFIAIEEISDLEPCPTPSPPRRKHPTIIQKLELSPEVPCEAPRGKKSSAIPHIPSKPYQDELFPHLKLHLFKPITTAVKSVPRTSDPQSPTWHEKILLYDPIVLEDFTDWLNSGPLQDAGFTEFSANITVPVRKKDGIDEEGHNMYTDELREKAVTVKAGEIDPWMVQKWCQDKSICCLWRGGLWGSVRLAY